MRKQIFLFSAWALFGVGLMAAAPQDTTQAAPAEQPHGEHHQADPARQVKMLARKLNLSADQQQQLLPVLQARQQQFEAIRNDGSLTSADRRNKMHAAREETDTKIKAILTDSQKQTYEQMQQQMRERMQQRHEQNQNGNQNPNQNPQQ